MITVYGFKELISCVCTRRLSTKRNCVESKIKQKNNEKKIVHRMNETPTNYHLCRYKYRKSEIKEEKKTHSHTVPIVYT